MAKGAVIVSNPTQSTTGGVVNTKNQGTVLPQIPFTRASMEHVEPFLDSSHAITASPVPVSGGPVDVPAYGFMSSILLLVTATGGTHAVADAVFAEDGPYSVIQDITLSDVNGAPIVILTGYDLYLANRWGGYNFQSATTTAPTWTAGDAGGNFAFALRIPVQIGRRDALGALPNTNASATYKLRITQAAETGPYSTSPTANPTVRWQAFLEAWAQPPAQGIGGGVNATQPPALGTTQFWSETQVGAAVGFNRIRLPRVGNLVRNLILVNRGVAAGTRAAGEGFLPTSLSLEWDSHVVFNASLLALRQQAFERFGLALDNGVVVIDYTHDFSGHPGDSEYRDLWVPTTQSSRLEVTGTWTGASNLTILTNDVAPVGSVFL